MKRVKLSDAFDLQMGKTPSRKHLAYWRGGTEPWISIADLSNCGKYIEQTKEIILEIQEDFDIEKISPNTAKNTAKIATNGDNSDNFAEVSEKSFEKSQNATLKLIEMLQNEIDKKDKELEKRDKRIEKLEATIEEHTKTIADLAKQASYITAADKTAQIIDKSQEQAEAAAAADDKPVKKKWFNFFSK